MADARTAVRFGTIELGGWLPPAVLSPNSSAHWRTRAKATAETRHLIQVYVLRYWWSVGDGEQYEDDPRRRLTVTMRRPRLLDEDNAVAICKAVIDGAIAGGAARDDSPRWMEIVVRQEQARKPLPFGTRLELEELTNEEV